VHLTFASPPPPEPVQSLFAEMDKALIAYSGGVDSTLVAKIAYDVLGDRALAVTAAYPSLLSEELADARRQAAEIGIAHEIVATHEMDNPVRFVYRKPPASNQ